MSGGFVYPVVVELRRAGAATSPVPDLGVAGRASSQRALVEASLLRCPDTPQARRGPHDHKAPW
jgi:hypothetical protein